jgi:hypothetical protein
VATPVGDIDTLRIQTELLSHIDGQGRIVGMAGLRINTARDGRHDPGTLICSPRS